MTQAQAPVSRNITWHQLIESLNTAFEEGFYDSTYIHARVDSLFTELGDTLTLAGGSGVEFRESGDSLYIDFEGGDSTYVHFRIDSLATVQNDRWAILDARFDLTPPYFSSAEIGDYDDSIVVVLFTENLLADSIPATTDFTLTENDVAFGINEITMNADTVFIALDSLGLAGATYLLSYTGTKLQDTVYNVTPQWTDREVTNNLGDDLGEELISNGDFTDGSTGWSLGTGWSVDDGEAHHVGTEYGALLQANTVSEAGTYRVVFTITAYTSGLVRPTLAGAPGTGTYRTATGTYEVDITTEGAGHFNLEEGTANANYSIDNISVREVLE